MKKIIIGILVLGAVSCSKKDPEIVKPAAKDALDLCMCTIRNPKIPSVDTLNGNIQNVKR